jgi:hypothetical protein
MSLEEALRENTEAVKAHTAALNKFMAAGASKAAGVAGTSTTKAADKPADKPADRPAAKPATAAKTTKAPTLDSVAERVTTFLKTGDKEQRDERKGQIGQINEYFGVERFTAIPAEKWPEALGYLKDFEEGTVPSFIDEGEGGDEEGGEDESLV